MHVLGVLEGEPARFRAMLAPLQAMVDAQLACQERSPKRRFRIPRTSRSLRTRLPDALTTRFEDLVLIVGEANAWPYREGVHHPDELVHWVAHRPATGESFEAIARPEHPISPSTSFHIGLADEVLRGGITRAELLARFASFLRPNDLIASWGTHGTNLYAEAGGTLPGERIDLRVTAQRLIQKKPGSLESYAASVGSKLEIEHADRAGRRLAGLRAIVAAWRALP